MYLLTKQINMVQISTIHSEVEIYKSIVKKFKQERVTDQTAFYLNERADIYYNPDKKFAGEQYDYSKITRLLENILAKKKGSKVVIVSLGCGNCEKDKIVLEHLQERGYNNIRFFGVDSSMAMIQKACNVLNNTPFEAHLICADFGALGFKKELDNIIGNYDIGIYLFFGNTFGNLHQGYIADVLKSILSTGDYLLLDIIGFKTITTTIQAKLFQRYLQYNENPADVKFHSGPIKALGVPEDCGKLTLEVTTDPATQARVFKFGFKVHTLTTLNLEEEEVNLSSNGRIHLIHILVYDLHKLTKFLEERSFKLKEQVTGKFLNQLLLQKQ